MTFYAAVFFLVNATYFCLIWELIAPKSRDSALAKVREAMLLRAATTLCLFAIAAGVALRYPFMGLGICVGCLAVYLRPDPPEVMARAARH